MIVIEGANSFSTIDDLLKSDERVNIKTLKASMLKKIKFGCSIGFRLWELDFLNGSPSECGSTDKTETGEGFLSYQSLLERTNTRHFVEQGYKREKFGALNQNFDPGMYNTVFDKLKLELNVPTKEKNGNLQAHSNFLDIGKINTKNKQKFLSEIRRYGQVDEKNGHLCKLKNWTSHSWVENLMKSGVRRF